MLTKNATIEIKPFLRWWGRELAFLIPPKIRQFFHTPRAAIIICPVDDEFAFYYEIDSKQEFLISIKRDNLEPEKISNLIAQPRFKNALFILRLSNRDGLSKTLNLPLAAQKNIYQVVSYELDRYSPFQRDQIYFDTRMDYIDNEAAQLVVQLLLVPKKILETYCSDCATLGISLRVADIENYPTDLNHLHTAYNLLPSHLKPKIKNTQRQIIVGLLALSFMLGFSVLALPVWLEYQAVQTLQTKISSIEKEVKAVKALQAEMDELREGQQALINEKIAVPPVVAILNEISALMKDDSWLSYLQYSEGQLQLQGESPTASNLLADLEASDYFANVSFASPVTQDKASGVERFQISAEVTRPTNSENSDVNPQETSEPTNDTTESTAQEPAIETTVEGVNPESTTEEEVIENGTSQE